VQAVNSDTAGRPKVRILYGQTKLLLAVWNTLLMGFRLHKAWYAGYAKAQGPCSVQAVLEFLRKCG